MARYSDNQGFVLPEDSDVFEVENVIAGNFEKADSALGLRFAPPMTAQEYAAMESRDSRTVYTVAGDGEFSLFLGDKPLKKDEGGFSPLEVVKAAASALAQSTSLVPQAMVYKAENRGIEEDTVVFMIASAVGAAAMTRGVYLSSFSDTCAKISTTMQFFVTSSGNVGTARAVGSWEVTEGGASYTRVSGYQKEGKNLYNLKSFACHPCYESRPDLLEVGVEIPLENVTDFAFCQIFSPSVSIGEGKNIMVFRYYSGATYMFIFPEGAALPTAEVTDGTAKIAVSAPRGQIDAYVGTFLKNTKQAVNFSNYTGSLTLDADRLDEVVLCTTWDMTDSEGGLFHKKNADVTDFLE
ncbi:MAG: hypothetical protein IJ740_06105 [Ruminococcus sp.]|nr:hypothetical protein [Ruminococcus sp.]